MPDIVRTMCVASASELIQQSDLYMTVKAVLFTTPSPNLNGVRCTEAFIDEIVANQDAYVGLPLNADIRSLESGQYNKLGHMFDQTTGTFATVMIGSFYRFEKTALPNGDTALIGYARIMKRNQAVCSAVGELFASGNLKFSFEISCGEYKTLEDGTMLIDASKDNYLEGMCIVWSPACPEAVAKELVAELTNDGKEAEEMSDTSAEATVEVTAEVVETVAENIEAEKPEENTEVIAEESVEAVAEKTKEVAEETKEDASETACDDKEETAETEEAQCKEDKKCAEEEAEKTQEVKAENEAVNAEDESGETTETKDVAAENLQSMIAELVKTVESLKTEIAELKIVKQEKQQAEIVAETNCFMDDISLSEKKYSLLEREPASSSYTLLDVE